MKNLIIIYCLVFSTISLALECEVKKPELSIYFGNGMFNGKDDTRQSLRKLRRLMANQLPGYQVSYKISYNHNENPMEQMLEVARQKTLQDYRSILLWLAGVETAPDWFQEGVESVVTGYDAFNYVFDGDLRRHVLDYSRDISQCHKVLLVAHSQGSFYGNEAWRSVYQDSMGYLSLNQLKLMGMVSVANPASQVGFPLGACRTYAFEHKFQ